MTATANADNIRQCKIRFSLNVEQILTFASNPNTARFSLIVEQILTFASNPNMVREVKSRLQISNKSRDDLLRY